MSLRCERVQMKVRLPIIYIAFYGSLPKTKRSARQYADCCKVLPFLPMTIFTDYEALVYYQGIRPGKLDLAASFMQTTLPGICYDPLRTSEQLLVHGSHFIQKDLSQ